MRADGNRSLNNERESRPPKTTHSVALEICLWLLGERTVQPNPAVQAVVREYSMYARTPIPTIRGGRLWHVRQAIAFRVSVTTRDSPNRTTAPYGKHAQVPRERSA
jgi:hypothetical protein